MEKIDAKVFFRRFLDTKSLQNVQVDEDILFRSFAGNTREYFAVSDSKFQILEVPELNFDTIHFKNCSLKKLEFRTGKFSKVYIETCEIEDLHFIEKFGSDRAILIFNNCVVKTILIKGTVIENFQVEKSKFKNFGTIDCKVEKLFLSEFYGDPLHTFES
jgi:hypothetical protein